MISIEGEGSALSVLSLVLFIIIMVLKVFVEKIRRLSDPSPATSLETRATAKNLNHSALQQRFSVHIKKLLSSFVYNCCRVQIRLFYVPQFSLEVKLNCIP